jgi:hypothetical protein
MADDRSFVLLNPLEKNKQMPNLRNNISDALKSGSSIGGGDTKK